MTPADARLRAALRLERPGDEPPPDWAEQVLFHVPAPQPQRPGLRETALWLSAWAGLALLAGLVAARCLPGEAVQDYFSDSNSPAAWLPALLLVAASQSLSRLRVRWPLRRRSAPPPSTP